MRTKPIRITDAEKALIKQIRKTAYELAVVCKADSDKRWRIASEICALTAQCLEDAHHRPGSWESEIGENILRQLWSTKPEATK